jgi:hypothetical protein
MLFPSSMENGRNHEQRSAHVRRPRHNNTPPIEGATATSGGHGSEVAPTREALEAEQLRHAEEEANGHFAAGVDGRARAVDAPDEEREGMDSTHIDDPPSESHTTAPEGGDYDAPQPGEAEGTRPTAGAQGPRP